MGFVNNVLHGIDLPLVWVYFGQKRFIINSNKTEHLSCGIFMILFRTQQTFMSLHVLVIFHYPAAYENHVHHDIAF